MTRGSTEKAKRRGTAAQPRAEIHVLVVEDSPTQAEALRALLADAGYQVAVAPSGEDGVAQFAAREFDVVISDIVMPGAVDGYELCRRIKADKRRDTPVVLLTSLSDPLDIIRGLECGADNFFTKSVEPALLLDRLQLLLTTKETRAHAKLRVGVKVFFMGREFTVTSGREQILDLLISTFEDAVRQNRSLRQREEELARSHQSLDGLYRIALGLNESGTEAEVAETALERALELPGVQAGWISLRDGETGFRIAAARGLPPALAAPHALHGECLCRRKLLAGELDSVTNILECERLRKATGDTRGLRYHASVPLWVGDRTIGVMNLAGPDEGLFGDNDLQVLYGVGNQVAVALERARLHEHLERLVEERTAALTTEIAERKRAEVTVRNHARQQAAIAELGRTALAGSDLASLLDAAVTLIAGTLGVEYCKVLELLPDGQALSLRAGTGWKAGYVGTTTVPAGQESMAGYTLLSNGPVVVDDLQAETRFRGPPMLLEHGVVSGLSVVIEGRERQFGVLGAHTTRQRLFTGDDVNFLQAVANILGTAIERRATELARAQLTAILEATTDLVATAGTDGRMLYMNQAGRRMLGIDPAEDISQLTISDLYPERERAQLLGEVVPAVLRDGVWRGETVFLARDGREIPVSVAGLAHQATADSPAFLSAIVRDLTETRRLEEQFRQSQKMEAIGRLAGGVAHDFNNLLTVIASYSQLLIEDLGAADPRRADLEEIRKAAAGAAGLTRQLLAFSRQQVLEPRVLDLSTVVSDAGKMLQRLIGEDVALVTVLAPDLGAVKADPGQLEQVIMNLAVNARDAMPQGGKLTIETANVDLDGAYTAEHTPVTPGPYVLLSVSDTGLGMDEETKRRLFEPFFTTKAIGKGTGLGLATVYGIVKQSGGFVWVYSEPEHGTTFKIYLPRVDELADAAQQASAMPESLRGTETVLLAEDAGPLRAVARKILQRNGYNILEAPDGKSALDEADRHDGPIHLLITDVIMPEMSGRQLAERLLERRPDLKVLFVSGYTDDAVIRHGVLEPGIAFLQKPFSPDALARKVREVLDSSPSI